MQEQNNHAISLSCAGTKMASNAVLTGGYDCKFMETPPDKLMCQICLSVAHTPHQMPCCGRVYCKACLDTHKKLSKTCPNCRSIRQSFPDTRGESKSESKIVLEHYKVEFCGLENE